MRANKRSVVDTTKTVYATKKQNSLGLIRITKFWAALKISWLRRFNSYKYFWSVPKQEWLMKLGYANFDLRNTDQKTIGLLCSKCPNPFWKKVYKGNKISTENYLKMYADEIFISTPIQPAGNNNQPNLNK